MKPFHALAHFRKAKPSVRIVRRTTLRVESMEDRTVPAALAVRPIDGTGNNIANPNWGTAGVDFLRNAPAAYADGVSSPAGASRPSAREVSNVLSDQAGQDIVSDRQLSAMIYAWGQFIDHDLDLTPTGTGDFPVPVPTGDPSFDPTGTGTQTIPLTRSAYDPATGTAPGNPRQQINSITAWLDGSMVYGSDAATAASLRTMVGGQMKTSAGNLLPTDNTGFFVAGDTRVDENPELTSMQTLFVREHNRMAAQISRVNPKLSDEDVYQQARAWVIAEIQVITYKEWLPALLGTPIPAYRGYNPKVNPGIANEFAAAGFRFGHSLLGDDIDFLGNDGQKVADTVSLADSFFNPELVKTNGIDPVLKYLASDPSSEVDTKVVDSVRNFLFGAPGSGGMDLASLNIQRGRDHGLSDYNTTRAAYHLPKVTNFNQITNDPATQAKLKQLYGNVNNIDLWIGVLAEKHVPGGSVGPTLKAIITDQFSRLRDGDRFWYQREFSGAQLQQLEGTTLAGLIRLDTSLTTVQRNTFFFKAEISGRAFGDRNGDGRLNGPEIGLAGITVQLVDLSTNEVVATKVTDARGNYKFTVADGLRTGRYTVRQVLPQGVVPTTSPDRPISIVSGDTIVMGFDLGSMKLRV
ncbi:peroxidase family protein [Zavarzinella formosa]|uniref:peroxidase family protein n=1 Tax=Zavarzinella formosa TaxID=360055 RepID=UPI0002DEFEC1|nr:peroxidase family protein [Zavarzinella formosa]